jgi:hypothetical protein
MRVRINDFLPHEESPMVTNGFVNPECHVAMLAASAMRPIASNAIILMCLNVVRCSAR